jgi:hypothetical protein
MTRWHVSGEVHYAPAREAFVKGVNARVACYFYKGLTSEMTPPEWTYA